LPALDIGRGGTTGWWVWADGRALPRLIPSLLRRCAVVRRVAVFIAAPGLRACVISPRVPVERPSLDARENAFPQTVALADARIRCQCEA
jgi:hypothetical protein